MKNVKIKMSSTIDKSLYYAQGNFILGYKYDNDTTKVIFEVPSDYKQPNGVVWLTPPIESGITKQTPIPLINESGDSEKGLYSLIVSGDITQYVGEWDVVLVLQSNDEEDIQTCISNKMIGIVKDSEIDPDNIEELPENSNIKILYNELKTLYEKIEETLLSSDIETIEEIQEDLEIIKNSLEGIISIDWESIQGLASVGEDMETLKNSIESISLRIGESENNTLFMLLGEILTILGNLNVSVDLSELDIKFENVNTNIDLLEQEIKNEINKVKESNETILNNTLDLGSDVEVVKSDTQEIKNNNETIINDIVNLENYIKTSIANKLETIESKIPDTSNIESEITNIENEIINIKNLIGYVNEELLNL